MNMRFPVNTKGRTIVTRKYTLIYALLFFSGSLLSFISSGNAQTCTPVVYAFRHAEDYGANLTLVGQRHAALYIDMLGSGPGGIGPAHNYCPVGYVYALYNRNTDGSRGTNNPLETAQPVAIAACTALGSCTGSEPRVALADGKYLYEYLAVPGAPPTCKKNCPASATAPELQAELASNASSGFSSAIFWTSQGLNVLGQAIAGEAVDIPGCPTPPKPATKCPNDKGVPPRNAVYVFEYNGSGFNPPVDAKQYVQCFDVQIKVFCTAGTPPTPPTLEGPTTTDDGETTYWCGNGGHGTGNLPATSDLTSDCEQTLESTFKDLNLLQGKICDTSGLPGSGPDYYGYCR
jgi:hypothetical protein